MPPSNIHWSGFPRYRLPRIRIASQPIIHDSPTRAAQTVFRYPLGPALQQSRQQQVMRARKHRIARSQATFPNLAIYRRSVRGDNRLTSGRQVIFPHSRRSSRLSSRRPSSTSSRRNSSHRRGRPTAQQKLTTSRASLRRNLSSHRYRSRRSTSFTRRSSRSSSLRRQSSTNSAPVKRLPQIRVEKSRSLKSHSPRPHRIASPSPYWGTIPGPAPIPRRKTPLDKQTFVSRRVGGKYVHEPLRIKQSANDVLHRGLSNSSRKSRIYDLRLPIKKPDLEERGYIVLPDPKPDPFLIASTLEFAKLDGSSVGRSSSGSVRRMYPDEESSSSSDLVAASRTTSEARALDDFTQGLQQHLRATHAAGNTRESRPRSPSVAPTVGSAHTLQDLVAFRNEFKAAGLAVTSKDQKGSQNRPQHPPVKRSMGVNYSKSVGANRRPEARRQSVHLAPPKHTYSSVATGVEAKSPKTTSPAVRSPIPELVAVRSSTPPSSIPIPREKNVSKKPLPWLKKSELKPGQEPLAVFQRPLPEDAPSPASTDRSSVTTIIDFAPHPSEFWEKRGLDFEDFQNRHPGLGLDLQRGPSPVDGEAGGIIMLENELAEPVVIAEPETMRAQEPEQEQEEEEVIVHDRSGPPKPVRVELHGGIGTSGGRHRPPSPLSTQLFPEDIDAGPGEGLVRADSFNEIRRESSPSVGNLPSSVDFSSFSSDYEGDYGRRSPARRPKSAGDIRSDRIVGRRASKEEIMEEKRRKSREEMLRAARAQAQFDLQRTKFEMKKVTPWELNSESTDSKKTPWSDEHPQVEIIGTKVPSIPKNGSIPQQNGGQNVHKGGLLSDWKSKMKRVFSLSDPEGSEEEREWEKQRQQLQHQHDSVPEPADPTLEEAKKQKEKPEKPVVAECEECQFLAAHPDQRPPSITRSLNEPKSARSFREWQAGVPFKPPSREGSLSDLGEETLPCGHVKKNKLDVPRVGDPVKRIVAARQTKAPSRIGKSRAPSIFTIQESVPKPPSPDKKKVKAAVPRADSSSDVSDGEVLKGLSIVMQGVTDEEVRAWIKEATGTNVRRFLANLGAMDKPSRAGGRPRTGSDTSKRARGLESMRGKRMGRSEGDLR